MNRPDRSTAACDTHFRTRSTLLGVLSNLVATARVGPWLAILHMKEYNCFVGGIGARPNPLPSGISSDEVPFLWTWIQKDARYLHWE